MQQAGVTLVSVGIFSWAQLEPREGEYDFGWLDDILDRLHARRHQGRAGHRHGEPAAVADRASTRSSCRCSADGTVLHPGGRQAYRVSSPVYREYALRMTRTMAERYRDHPALALWHVDNELGCHVPHDFSDDAAAAFRRWLARPLRHASRRSTTPGARPSGRSGTTTSTRCCPRAAPRRTRTRRSSWTSRGSAPTSCWCTTARCGTCCGRSRPTCRRPPTSCSPPARSGWTTSPGPTTSTSSPTTTTRAPTTRRPHIELAFSADLTRGVAGGEPVDAHGALDEAVNWQPRNRTKRPGEMLRHSLAHVARGADAVMFFQWRQSAAGAEKFHSAMLPHAGTRHRRVARTRSRSARR